MSSDLSVPGDGGESDNVCEPEGAGSEKSQLSPGFTVRLTVSLSFTGYSCKSFPSARTFPLRRRRWASAGGRFSSKLALYRRDGICGVDRDRTWRGGLK